MSNLRLTSRALTTAELAAVSVVVEDVLVGAKFTAWGRLEADREDQARENANLIREGCRFEPHLLVDVVRLVLLEGLFVHRCQILLVHVSWGKEKGITSWVGR